MPKRYTLKQFKKLQNEGRQLEEDAIVCSVAPSLVTRDVAADGTAQDRVLTFTISTADEDRDNDTIAVDGWDITNFSRGGTVLWSHDYNQPVATPLATWVEPGALKSRALFMPKDMNEFAYMVYRMANEGYVRAASVGFKPIEWSYNEERGIFAMDFKRQELLEWSVVPVPSNPNALRDAKSKGIDVAPLGQWLEKILDNDESSGAPFIARGKAEKLWKIVRDVEQVSVPAPVPEKDVAVIEAENEELRARVAELEKAAQPTDDDGQKSEPQSAAGDEPTDGFDLFEIVNRDAEPDSDGEGLELTKEDVLSAIRECVNETVKQSYRYHSGSID